MNTILENTIKIPAEIWSSAISYTQYFQLLEDLNKEGKTTGELQTPDRLEHAKLNISRMKRIHQQYEPAVELLEDLNGIKNGIKFLFIVEGWCGDAAQQVPALEKIVNKMGWESRYILRDEHEEIMNLFLTNGGKSIPVVIALDEYNNVLGKHWGPRPAELQKLVLVWKEEMDHEAWHKLLHSWYAKDKAKTVALDFAQWLIPSTAEGNS